MTYRPALRVALIAALTFTVPARAEPTHHKRNDYPTAARADYVIGCLAANGFKRELLDKCACGIDTIADFMPYDDYEKADTILRMQQGGLGERGALFRDTPVAREETEKLRRAQAEVNLRCR
ncbi:MAG TPA: hypothetical protein VNT30_16390 [Stellaceae bacterium]|nr:hypothetical protein [Stellaceae bacterium]